MLYCEEIVVATNGRGFYEISTELQSIVGDSAVGSGLCNTFITHTSASLLITENADPAVLTDLETFMTRAVVDGDPIFVHDAEGPDDMAAHIRSVLTQTSLSVPIRNSRLALGTWQGVFVWEHRAQAHRRRVLVTVLGDRT
ncbi:MAG: secondary thiamine-phosphate synthase enzyme YjbQ [Pseudomonadota bacterium]